MRKNSHVPVVIDMYSAAEGGKRGTKTSKHECGVVCFNLLQSLGVYVYLFLQLTYTMQAIGDDTTG